MTAFYLGWMTDLIESFNRKVWQRHTVCFLLLICQSMGNTKITLKRGLSLPLITFYGLVNILKADIFAGQTGSDQDQAVSSAACRCPRVFTVVAQAGLRYCGGNFFTGRTAAKIFLKAAVCQRLSISRQQRI
jgi:hypothetical protein